MPKPTELRTMSDADWSAFARTVRYVVRRLRLDVTAYEDGALITPTGGYALRNLAQLCTSLPRREWNDLVHHHLVAVSRGLATPTPFDIRNARVRLHPERFAGPDWDPQIVSRPFTADVVAIVVADLPDTIQVLRRSDLEASELDEEEVWDEAWGQTRLSGRPEHDEVSETSGAPIRSMLGSNFFTASLVRYLPDLVGEIGEQGALVAIPRRHTILAHVITDARVAYAVNTMVPWTVRLFDEGPGSISRGVYWWREGSLELLPATLEHNTIEFRPPSEFDAMIARMADGPRND
jgi:hypothetical protein